MNNQISIGGKIYDISDDDFIPNLGPKVGSKIILAGDPDLAKKVVDLWCKATAMKQRLMTSDVSDAELRLIKMAKFMLPLFEKVNPQLGKIHCHNPNDYIKAYRALIQVLADYDVERTDQQIKPGDDDE